MTVSRLHYQTAFVRLSLWWQEKGSGDIVSIARVVSAYHDFRGVLIDKINITLINLHTYHLLHCISP